MESLHKFYVLFLLYLTGEVSGLVQLEPQNAFVLQGTSARFNCSLQGDFQVMGWLINGRLALTISMQAGVLGNSHRFSANNFSSGIDHCWEFVVRDVQRNDSGTVTCDVQNIQIRDAQMSVQESGTVAIVGANLTVTEGSLAELRCEASGWFPAPALSWARNGSLLNSSLYNSSSSSELSGNLFNATSVLRLRADVSAPVECRASIPALSVPLTSTIYMVVETPVPKPADWTVLIAVVVSIGGFALLVLLILGILFCCKRRNKDKSSYEEEMRRARALSQVSIVSGTRQKPSHVNLGYVTDDHTKKPPSDFSDSGYGHTNGSTFVPHFPDIVNSTQTSGVHVGVTNTIDGNGIKNHRHATIV